jgi:hypothetical protein
MIAGGRRYIPAGKSNPVRRLAVKRRINYPLLFGTRWIAELYGVTDALPVTVFVVR